jgi:hypothetical protein
MRDFLVHYGVASIIAQHIGVDPDAAYSLIEAALGAQPRHVGGVDVWLGVQKDVQKGNCVSDLQRRRRRVTAG